MRVSLLIILCALAWFGIGPARAAGTCNATTRVCSDRQAAYTAAMGNDVMMSQCSWGAEQRGPVLLNGSGYAKERRCKSSNGVDWFAWIRVDIPTNPIWTWAQECPSGKTWNDSLKQCFSPQECLARNADLPDHPTVRNYANACVAGCRIKANGPTVGVDGLFTGLYQYSGDICTASPPSLPEVPREEEKKDPPQECKPAENGMTFCLKPDGQHCATASNGRQVCWRPGETGEKDDGSVRQKRDPGTEPIPPNLSLPNGDNLQPAEGPITKTTTITSSDGTVRSITTTIKNYTTVSGADAGPKNEGQSSSGTDSPSNDEGDPNTLTGGTTCAQPPVSTGDPILGSIALQTWKTRCQGEDNKASGGGDCQALFQCSGEEILCTLAMEKRKERCDYEARRALDTNALEAIASQPDGTEGINVGDMFHSFDRGDVNENLLGGGAGGQCEFTFTLGGQRLEMTPEWWDVVRMISMLMVAFAYLWIARQLGG